MKGLGIDQSLAKCAIVYAENGVFKQEVLYKTGKSSVKTKRKDTTYYDCLHDQINHICKGVMKEVLDYQPEYIVFEALSFGSAGNATRDLACLYGAIRNNLKVHHPDIKVYEVAPTSLKSYAHNFLKEESKWDGKLKSGKPKKVKMDKKKMVESVKEIYGQDFLKGYNYSSGLDDLADATLLVKKVYEETKEETC